MRRQQARPQRKASLEKADGTDSPRSPESTATIQVRHLACADSLSKICSPQQVVYETLRLWPYPQPRMFGVRLDQPEGCQSLNPAAAHVLWFTQDLRQLFSRQ